MCCSRLIGSPFGNTWKSRSTISLRIINKHCTTRRVIREYVLRTPFTIQNDAVVGRFSMYPFAPQTVSQLVVTSTRMVSFSDRIPASFADSGSAPVFSWIKTGDKCRAQSCSKRSGDGEAVLGESVPNRGSSDIFRRFICGLQRRRQFDIHSGVRHGFPIPAASGHGVSEQLSFAKKCGY